LGIQKVANVKISYAQYTPKQANRFMFINLFEYLVVPLISWFSDSWRFCIWTKILFFSTR